ncbi:hypothetical protein PESP_a1236 [Pseudoalteromonas espejiana DSM 9414]|nr:hypothetical protein PESP_a1236 [Pseudoalteromonas espejiana DSM 9414]
MQSSASNENITMKFFMKFLNLNRAGIIIYFVKELNKLLLKSI